MDELKKSPEDWLAASEEKQRGRCKVFLGYAPGVGKTFSMLSEGIRLRSRGEDVVIGIIETHGRSGTAELARAAAETEAAAESSKIRMRRMTYSQAAGWAATLPCGICPADLARRMTR